jgi:hypothetical protein
VETKWLVARVSGNQNSYSCRFAADAVIGFQERGG